MEIKGTSVIQTLSFVKVNFPNRYHEWIERLPEESKKILSQQINPIAWYPLEASTVIPTRIIGEFFYANAKKGAIEVGKYSSSKSLTGVYKIFVRVADPKFMISRASNIFGSYYKPSEISTEIISNNEITVIFKKFNKTDLVLFNRIEGWMYSALILSKCTGISTKSEELIVNEEYIYKINVKWQ